MLSYFASVVVVCLAASIAQSADVPVQRSIVTGPLNDALEAGPGIVLNCEASGPNERVQWFEFTQSATGNQISENDFLLPGNPNVDRYTIDHPADSTTYNLGINPTVLSDGGQYECLDISDSGVPGYAEIILLDGPPVCTTNIPDDGYVREDQYYTIECTVGYRGNVAPKMTWSGPDPDEWGPWVQTTTTTNTSVFTGVAMNMSRFFSGFTFSLLANFTEEGFNTSPHSATNVPTWNFTYSTAQLYVQWAPQRMYRAPEQDTYEPGEFIECFSDSNPSAKYSWRNLETLQFYVGARLDLTEEWIGTWRMQCNAENVIDDVTYTNDYFFLLVVNPRTTTPLPTTPTTTEPPPAEAPCDDLTGRWTATYPSFVDMCLEINNANGRIIGLFRNATDPYFVEVRGRVAPNKFNQIGFTGVWPVNIGTLSFGGICRKCFGTEVLQITGVGRKVTDNPSCDNAGPIYNFADYAFARTGPPCRGLLHEYSVKF